MRTLTLNLALVLFIEKTPVRYSPPYICSLLIIAVSCPSLSLPFAVAPVEEEAAGDQPLWADSDRDYDYTEVRNGIYLHRASLDVTWRRSILICSIKFNSYFPR